MKSIVTLICLALMNIFALSVEALAEPMFEGTIVFMKNDLQIYLINDVTGHETQVTQSEENLWPRWSPDGTRFVFSHDYQIYMYDVHELSMSPVTYLRQRGVPAQLSKPSFDSTGKYIYASTNDHRIVVIDLTAGKAFISADAMSALPKKLHMALSIEDVAESPTGRYLAGRTIFKARPRGIVLIDVNEETRTVFAYSEAGPPAWSRDGSRLSFVDPRVSGDVLVIYDVAAQTFTELPINHAGRGYCCSPISWSPDSRFIAYNAGKENESSVFLYNIETQEETELFPGSSADWRPVIE